MTAPPPAPQRGIVLVMVLVMIAMLAMLSVSCMLLVRADLGAATAARRGHQARAAALSGIHRAMAVLLTGVGEGESISDNPGLFQAQKITGEGGEEWYFTVFSENLADPSSPRYGPADESARLHLNTATEQMLLRLPGMTEPLVQCLLDYRDRDTDPRPQGLEQDQLGAGAHLVKNAPLYTPEELLLVKGFTGQVVFGEDANLNAALEPNEDDGEETFPPDNRDGQLDLGLRPLVTTFSYDPDLDSQGNPRIDINRTGEEELKQRLEEAGIGQATADFIIQARKARVRFTDPSQLLEMELEVPDPKRKGRKVRISSGVGRDNLAAVMDKLTCAGGSSRGRQMLPARINVNAAPLAVVRTLPDISDATSQWIVDTRAQLDADARATTAWLYTAPGGVSAEFFKKIAPLLTPRGYQFRVRSFGYNMTHGTFCVLEAVIDLGSGRPEIIYLRDLTRLGPPMPVTTLER